MKSFLSRPKERQITEKTLKSLNQLGGYWVKVHGGPFQTVGLPDIVGCFQGNFFGLEIKRPGKTATPRQLMVLARIASSGGFSGVVTSPEEALSLVSSAITKQKGE